MLIGHHRLVGVGLRVEIFSHLVVGSTRGVVVGVSSGVGIHHQQGHPGLAEVAAAPILVGHLMMVVMMEGSHITR